MIFIDIYFIKFRKDEKTIILVVSDGIVNVTDKSLSILFYNTPPQTYNLE